MLPAEADISGEVRDIPGGGSFGDKQHTLCLRMYLSCCSYLLMAGEQDAQGHPRDVPGRHRPAGSNRGGNSTWWAITQLGTRAKSIQAARKELLQCKLFRVASRGCGLNSTVSCQWSRCTGKGSFCHGK